MFHTKTRPRCIRCIQFSVSSHRWRRQRPERSSQVGTSVLGSADIGARWLRACIAHWLCNIEPVQLIVQQLWQSIVVLVDTSDSMQSFSAMLSNPTNTIVDLTYPINFIFLLAFDCCCVTYFFLRFNCLTLAFLHLAVSDESMVQDLWGFHFPFYVWYRPGTISSDS